MPADSAGVVVSLVSRIFPFLQWRKTITAATLRADVIAGASTALVLVPLSMANAQLAGVPAYYGLYAGSIPCILAGLFGSSRQVVTCAVALICLMTAAALEPLAPAGSEAFIAYAILLTFMVGLFQLALGLMRLGVLVNFISHPVISGFTSAGAIIIIVSQFSYLIGVKLDSRDSFLSTVIDTARAVVYVHWPTLVYGLGVMALMIILRKIHKRIPHVLIAVSIITLIAKYAHYEYNVPATFAQVHDPQAMEIVHELQQTLAQVKSDSSARQKTAAQLQTARSQFSENSREVIQLNSQLQLIQADLDQARQRSSHLRESLPKIHFDRIKTGGGHYYFARKTPGRTSEERRDWRIIPESITDGSLKMQGGGVVVGNIPGYLPKFSLPGLDANSLYTLLTPALLIALFGFMNATSLAKAIAAHTGQRIDPNQELIGQGLANLTGSFFRSSPTSPSFTASTVNFTSGAATGLASVIAGTLVLMTLIFLSPLLYYIPKSVLGGVVILSVSKLVDFSQFKRAWKTHKHDGIVAVGTFICTLTFSPDLNKGIFGGILLSLGLYLYRRMFPNVVTLSLYGDGAYRDARRYDLLQCRHIAAIRFDGSLFFANASYLEDKIIEQIGEMPQLRHVLLDASAINDLDASGVEVLSQQTDRLRQAGYDLSISGLRSPILDTLRRTGLLKKLGEDHIYLNVAEAARALHPLTHAHSLEAECPLLTVCEKKALGHFFLRHE